MSLNDTAPATGQAPPLDWGGGLVVVVWPTVVLVSSAVEAGVCAVVVVPDVPVVTDAAGAVVVEVA